MEKSTVSDKVTPADLSDDAEKMGGFHHCMHDPSSNKTELSDSDSAEFQGGVQRVRAMTTTWSTKTLVLMFILTKVNTPSANRLYLVSFVDALLGSVEGSLNPYITSSFDKHGLLTVVSVVSTILGGSSTLSLAKIIDVWGRVEGFLLMLLLVTIGMIMKATCTSMEMYTAAHTLYWVGHIGLIYVVDIMLADMTSLRNRMLILGINGTPGIASVFAGPKIANLFYTNLDFHWAFGAFAIMLVGVSSPAAVVMLVMQRRAERTGVLEKARSGRVWWQSVAHYCIEFDVIGIILITAAFSLILLPFSIASYGPKGWATGYIIAMEVLGVACIPVFYIWERYYSPVQFLPWRYLKEPTIIGSCLLYGVMFISVFAWNSYFGSYLQVVNRLDITTAGYVLNSFSLTAFIFNPIIGLLIRYTGDFKWTAMAGVPIFLLGTALLIPFRTPDTHVGLLTMVQILVGLGTCLFTVCGQIAVMASVRHQDIAVVMAIWGLFGSIGASVGIAIAGGMWNNILLDQLRNRLPEASKPLAESIFANMVTQMSYQDGTPERDAIVGAYGDLQRKMAIVGVCFVPLCILCTWFWRNVNVKRLEKEQTTGHVF
ncbi:Major facilitator superfamily domain general substrate transporter [Penicillium bovifimosum]|uniref:Major facilitator superfamily domain general substrate transporter n=1 Tax=Penicillium bovifimosum TaxID=126998 RepID=A0A9W9KZX7_9EURO|nr:Major facilitator superfamily domain general substrate transporter [Penicillium bovifimosum]KAJ5129170.1 Major facilitator superfamily domain general substrate transporter [Penicillium bovifimosum]